MLKNRPCRLKVLFTIPGVRRMQSVKEIGHVVVFSWEQDYVSTAMAKIKVDQLQDSTLAQLELAESHQHAGPLHPRGPRGLPPRRSSIGPSVLGRSNLGAGVPKRLRSKTMRMSLMAPASSPSRSGEGLLRAQASSKEMVLATTEGPRSEVRGERMMVNSCKYQLCRGSLGNWVVFRPHLEKCKL